MAFDADGNAVDTGKSVDDVGDAQNLKTYTSLEQIGITVGEETIEAIANAMPNGSFLIFSVGEANNASIYPIVDALNIAYGTCIVQRRDTRVSFEYIQNTGDGIWKGSYYHSTSGGVWSGWKEIAYADEFFPLTGGRLTGNLEIKNGYGRFIADGQLIQIEAVNKGSAQTDKRILQISNYADRALSQSIKLYEAKNGTTTSYNLYGEHNTRVDLKTYNSPLRIFTSEEIAQAIVTDFNTSIANILTAFPNNSILSFNVNPTNYSKLMEYVCQKINTDCGTNYSTTGSYLTLVIKKWTNNTMPTEVEVIFDNGNCKYKCICETDSNVWAVSKFAETFNPNGLATQIQSLLSGGEISVVKSVQRGTTTATEITINAVNPDKCVVILDNDLLGVTGKVSTDRQYLVNGTTLVNLTATKLTIGANVSGTGGRGTVSWQVIEYY